MKRRHHYVSQFLLRTFTEAGQFTVAPLDGSAPHRGDPKSIGWRRDSHQSGPLAEDPDAFEDAQAALESDAAASIHRLIVSDDRTVPGHDRETLERFLVLHMFRHPVMMQSIHESTAGEFKGYESLPDLPAMRRALLAQAVTFPADLEAKFTRSQVDDAAQRWAAYRSAFDTFTWNILRFERPSLVIGDAIICLSRLASDRRVDERQYGASVGLAWAERITVPLSPTVGLLLSREGRISRLRAEAFNRATVGCATEFIAYPPSWPEESPLLFANVQGLLSQRHSAASGPGLS